MMTRSDELRKKIIAWTPLLIYLRGGYPPLDVRLTDHCSHA
jgi:hypothetical protein